LAAFLDKPCDDELAQQIAEKCSFANLKNAAMNIKEGGDKLLKIFYRKGQHLIHVLKKLQGIPSNRHDIKQFVISLLTFEKKKKLFVRLICLVKILVFISLEIMLMQF
jgi:hypothetical protein